MGFFFVCVCGEGGLVWKSVSYSLKALTDLGFLVDSFFFECFEYVTPLPITAIVSAEKSIVLLSFQ